MRSILALLLAACGPPGPEELPVVVLERPPAIVAKDLRCDADDAVWTLEIATDAWAGGGFAWFTEDGAYVERHPVDSVAAAADGTSDALFLELGVVADWRDATPGASTAFTCGSAPDVLFRLQDLDGAVVDCASWGPDPAIWDQVPDLAACD